MHLLPPDWIVRMQCCMNFQTICWPNCNVSMKAAARLLAGTGKYDHISAAVKSFHWLPIK